MKPRVRIRSGERFGAVVPMLPPVSRGVCIAVDKLVEFVAAGEVAGVAIVTIDHEGSVSTWYADGKRPSLMLGGIARLSARIIEGR